MNELDDDDARILIVVNQVLSYAQREIRAMSAPHPDLVSAIDSAAQLAQLALYGAARPSARGADPLPA
jgi:hypothetical protein